MTAHSVAAFLVTVWHISHVCFNFSHPVRGEEFITLNSLKNWTMSALYIVLPPTFTQSNAILLFVVYLFAVLTSCTGLSWLILTSKRCQSHGESLHKSRSWSSHIPANESVELLGKEHSSDQCHMMQEVCQHFSSSSLAIGSGTYTLPASKGWIMEASHEPGDTLQPFFFLFLVVN